MTYESPYGKPEGLRDRLAEWVQRLSNDRNLPWVGLGLIDDLDAATAMQDRIDSLFKAIKHGDFEHQNWLFEKIQAHFYPPAPQPEYDL